MKIPYTINIDYEKVNLSYQSLNISGWCRYLLPFAKERRLHKTTELQLFSQHSIHNPFFIDLIDIEVEGPSYIPFVVHDRQLFMCFTLSGSLLYVTENRRPIVRTQANTLMMSYYDKGSYFAYAEEGKHILLVVSMHLDWIKSITQDYKNIQCILQRFTHSKRLFETMYMRRMDRKIQRWLYKIYSYSRDNKGALDGNLRKYISLLLEYYDKALEDQDNDIAFEIKTFVEANYRDTRLSTKFLSDHFNMTERTLTNIFKRRYHLSVQQYYTDLRIEKAINLMDQESISIKDVYMKVGYTDERTFRYALESYQKRNE
ncbi:helix-turn-helix domain-containing protein [Sphingobacterium sp. UDSM-2020]|uniref:helix-turn-helix domain-containing protein n=1 Tax=Sphingobacterium sp. UDSM-2020 TaxID=2795738 RepID=UPI0019357205|nr:helix-turn-helix domain-containing protein [Sphingobacterium sp. UDSM-2020]QQD14403.1 AraC family transcriptional regulator [Sphingobacterium sp. UDSM-2020]